MDRAINESSISEFNSTMAQVTNEIELKYDIESNNNILELGSSSQTT